MNQGEGFDAVYGALMAEAEKRRELPSQKIHQKILVTGHSLGGASAQRAFFEMTAGCSVIRSSITAQV